MLGDPPKEVVILTRLTHRRVEQPAPRDDILPGKDRRRQDEVPHEKRGAEIAIFEQSFTVLRPSRLNGHPRDLLGMHERSQVNVPRIAAEEIVAEKAPLIIDRNRIRAIEHHVGANGEAFQLEFQFPMKPKIVGVEKRDEWSPRERQAEIAGRDDAAASLLDINDATFESGERSLRIVG